MRWRLAQTGREENLGSLRPSTVASPVERVWLLDRPRRWGLGPTCSQQPGECFPGPGRWADAPTCLQATRPPDEEAGSGEQGLMASQGEGSSHPASAPLCAPRPCVTELLTRTPEALPSLFLGHLLVHLSIHPFQGKRCPGKNGQTSSWPKASPLTASSSTSVP